MKTLSLAFTLIAGLMSFSAFAHPNIATHQAQDPNNTDSDPTISHMQFITTDKPEAIKEMKIRGAAVAKNQQKEMLYLQISCQDYLSIYNAEGKPQFLSFLTASQADTFRAGYCLAAIKTYFPNFQCKPVSPYQAAQFLVKSNINNFYSVNQQLTAAICPSDNASSAS